MITVRNFWSTLVLVTLALGYQTSAQSDEINPEIDVYRKLAPDLRFNFQAKQSREGGTPNSPEIGPSLDYYLWTMKGLKDIRTPEDKDDSKVHVVVLSIGYRYF